MNIAIVGCGYVADFYMQSLKEHENLKLVGIYDTLADRMENFGRYYSAETYKSFEALLDDSSVEMVLNLTNPHSHYEVTKSCILAGKHVYSEKPVSMDLSSAQELLKLADEHNVQLGSAPCSLLGETAQTIWKALDEGLIGKVRLVYANFDSGMTIRSNPSTWRSTSGNPWPMKDEFEVGCTYEHAGYILTWLAAFFGPAQSMTAFASCQMPDKGIELDVQTPDFSVGCIEYPGNVVARITNSIIAPVDRSMSIIGDRGVIYTRELRNDASPVYLRNYATGRLSKLEKRMKKLNLMVEEKMNDFQWSWNNWQLNLKVPYARKPTKVRSGKDKPVDFCRGPDEMAKSIREGRPCRLSGELGIHIFELIEGLQYPEKFERRHKITSTFAPIKPLEWKARVPSTV